MVTDDLQFAEQQTLNCYDIGRKHSKYIAPQQFVEMLLQNQPWLIRHRKSKSYVFLAHCRVPSNKKRY